MCARKYDHHPGAPQARTPEIVEASLRRGHRSAFRGLRGGRCRCAGGPICKRGARPALTREVVWDRGVSLPSHQLWLDPLVVRSFAFISHAHTDHARRHKEALLTPQTLALIPEGRRPRGWRMLGLGESLRRGPATVTLYSAGHMLGSAQLLFEHGGERVLYTGDIKLRQPGGLPATFVPRADVLIIETT